MMHKRPFVIATVIVVAVSTTTSAQTAINHGARRKLELLNDSGDRVAVDWINPSTGKPLNYWAGNDGERMHLDSFVNHTFVVHRLSDPSSSSGSNNVSSTSTTTTTTFTVAGDLPATEIQHMVVRQGLQVERLQEENDDHATNPEASEMVFRCRIAADTALARNVPINQVFKDMEKCLEKKTVEALITKSEELQFQSELRKKLSSMAENYTCSDRALPTSEPVRETIWTHHGVTRKVGILHDRPSSQIHVLHNFISREECDAVQKAAQPLLHRGTVADGKGGSRMSENRKAWQAGLKVDWDKEGKGDPIAAVSRRLFDYANHVTGYNMRVDGQEDLMSIQYFGNGTDDPRPDRYTPHCDGDCDGMPHKIGGRVATMVMYCDVPELGGGTNFQNANVFVRPEAGAAAFFSYMDPKTRIHEEGYTSHSGCPVYQGTKRIAVQWMRVGVDLNNPWDSFDTNTVKKKLRDEEEEEYYTSTNEETEDREAFLEVAVDDGDQDFFKEGDEL